MTEDRDNEDRQLTSGTANGLPGRDLVASRELDEWIEHARPEDREPSGRAAEMLTARAVLRSDADAATQGELEALLTGALRRLDQDSAPTGDGSRSTDARSARSGTRATGGRRGSPTRLRWITGAAAAVVLLAGIGALLISDRTAFESAEHSADPPAATQQPAYDAGSAEATTDDSDALAEPESSDSPEVAASEPAPPSTDAPASESRTEEIPGVDAAGDQAAGQRAVGSAFAGIHVTARMRLP